MKGEFQGEKYWPAIYRRALTEPEPVPHVFTVLAKALAQRGAPEDQEKWLRKSLTMKTWAVDSHPSLTDRLTAMGVHASPGDAGTLVKDITETPPSPSAGEQFLSSQRGRLTEELDGRWAALVKPAWTRHHNYARTSLPELEKLIEKEKTGGLTDEEGWTRVKLALELHGDEGALPLLQNYLTRSPGHAFATYEMGRLLLARGDSSGMEYLDKAMQKDPGCASLGYDEIETYMRGQGREEDALDHLEHAEKHLNTVGLAARERQTLISEDELLPHGQPQEAVAKLCETLRRFDIEKAYLVRKAVKYFPERPAYFLAYVPSRAWYKLQTSESESELTGKIADAVTFKEDLFVITLVDRDKIRKKIEAIESALVFSAKAKPEAAGSPGDSPA